MESKRNNTNELTKQRVTGLENKLMVDGRKIGGRDREIGMDICTLLYLKRITNKNLLHSSWNSAECYVAARMGGEWGERNHVSVRLSPFAVHRKLS